MACTPCLGRSSSGGSDGTKRRRRPRPFARHLGISLATCAIFLASFILFLLVGLSVTIIKSIYIFQIQFATNPDQPVTSIATDLQFGVWGVCAYSQLGNAECIGPSLGYTIPNAIANLTGFPAIVDDVASALTVLLILHIVAAGLAFIVEVTSLFLESHAMCIISLVTSILTVLIGAAVFGIDLALILVGKSKIGPLTEFNYTLNWGPGLWMVLAGVVLSFVGMILMSVVWGGGNTTIETTFRRRSAEKSISMSIIYDLS
ncbi:hypothetical protein DICSQDRAFT_129426 [Dichomitus squalens LYAD-421 SS1]|uniref:Pali-domain-containing protein n=1 Tax=Dichomitus squalens (strain LYAD-421) TaxID=732165 RepID=R7SN17_DICSQ|nr:uncharacterized protein DICSQDRAFT_129426 [Dichomitus squalens LYAD-421 SS1]EJF57521.1 hypothetical protein DICSQDRAFT_129426 [Dichomitus squalens LYAD-421 SS1]